MSNNFDDRPGVHIGATAYEFPEHTGWIYTVAWSHDSKRIASAGRGGEIKIWNATDGGRVIKHREGVFCVYSLAWSPAGKEQYLVSANHDHTVRIRNITTGTKRIPVLKHKGVVRAVAWSRNGDVIASGGADATVRLWTLDGQELAPYEGHKRGPWFSGGINTVAWSPIDNLIASGGTDKTIQIWNSNTYERMILFKRHTRAINAVAWSPNGKWLASAGKDKIVWLFNIEEEENVLPIAHKEVVTALSWSPDGKKLAFASLKEVRIYDIRTSQSGTTTLSDDGPIIYDHSNWVRTVAWSPDGKYIASAGNDKIVSVWDAALPV